MKANELMIGDWVLFEPLKESISTERVIGLGEGVVKIRQFWVSMKEIKPIPLTAEILEKNGFILQQFGHFRYENEDNDLVMAFYPKKKNYMEGGYDYIDIYKGRMTLREMPISYVHELQHILKDCRIDKEIVL